MTTLELINGAASEQANSDAGTFFGGTIAPRNYQVSESLLDQANTFLEEMFHGRKSRHQIAEAFSTSSFTLGVFAAIDTQLMAKYNELPSVWRQYTTVTTVPDFRPTRLLDKWTDRIGLRRVPELTEYPTDGGIGHATYWINVAKYGLRDEFSWEASINNTIVDEIEEAPGKYSRAASETETINALANLLNIDEDTHIANGPNTDFFKAGNGNAPDNRPLTAQNLAAVLREVRLRKVKGRLVAPPDLHVVIPKALEDQAEAIRNLIEIRKTVGDDTEVYRNYLSKVEFVVEPMLDAINTHAKASTTWFVLPRPGSPRPATFAAFLRGYEAPDFRYKADAGQRIGGGDITPLEGSFDTDGIQTRVRHVLGHQSGDPQFTYVSLGS